MATKRKLEDTDIEEIDWRNKPIKTTLTKHSLDSDEEDDNDAKAYDILDEEAIEGQEEGVAGIEGDTVLTPFNMNEEMEEGHFDADGMYHWKKDGNMVRDNWLDNIDWVKIHKDTKGANKSTNENDDSFDLSSSKFDDIAIRKEMLMLMKPRETVAKALRRLAGSKNISSAERWKRKKAGIDMTKEEAESKQNVSKLTELANKILQNTGNMDIYQESYEYISEKVQTVSVGSNQAFAKAPELDMYADDFDSKEKERLESKELEPLTTLEAAKPPADSEVTWEFKLEKESEEINGPHTSEEMLKWTEDGTFKKEVWVRKCGQIGDFYTSKRIDFDLYI